MYYKRACDSLCRGPAVVKIKDGQVRCHQCRLAFEYDTRNQGKKSKTRL